jgi:hypothetical protein
VPSRGRPDAFARFLDSFEGTTAGVSDVILRNGEGDPTVEVYGKFASRVKRFVGSDSGYNTTWEGTAGYAPAQQDIWERHPGYAAYLTIEDDTVLHTEGFDKILLAEFDRFPDRVGALELADRAGTITVQCFSREWIARVGALCLPAVGEQAFDVSRELAKAAGRYAASTVEFTHVPHLGTYGYGGDERPGAMELPGVPDRFYEQRDWVNAVWKPQVFDLLVEAITA